MAETRELPEVTAEALSALEDRFPGAAQPAEWVGLVIEPDQALDVATFLRDEMGYAYLSCVTALDYPDETEAWPARYEVAYNLCRSEGSPLILHVHANRDDPVVPSLVEVWSSANVQEREAWDLMGIRFAGHPDLRRILLWEGFEGHPLRKDWHEPYYEEDQKPFHSRFPEGQPVWSEQETTFGRNLRYPQNWVEDGVLRIPESWESEAEDAVYQPLELAAAAERDELNTERVVLNIGPQHPSTHGVLRMVACLDGETVCALEPVLGYLHRNHEKIGERNLWLGNMPFTDRLDYITSMYNNFGYAVAVEKLMDVEVPDRAAYIRVIMGELTRLMNHLVSVGFLCNDLGIYFTAMLYALEEREFIIDLFEMASGSRMMCNYFRFGGVAQDLPDGFVSMARDLVFERFPRRIDEMEAYLLDNEVFRARTKGIGVLPPEAAVAYGCTGPLLRGSGVPYDVRRAEPYSSYDEFDWDVVVHNNGDVFDRVSVRFGEMRESLRILRQALDRLPDGPVQGGRVRPNTRVPEGEAYGRVEHPKGELGFYLVSDGGQNPYRYHIRTPSFVNLGVLGELCRGHKIADIVAILGSIDITLGEVDR
jgi:NADH:ubiquinone oxidoreductase subunit D/NADH:ubiquinone oxidoreductase subunit C